MQRVWSSEGSGTAPPSMDPVNLILHFLPLCPCCNGLFLILQWKLCFQKDPGGPRSLFWNHTEQPYICMNWITMSYHFFWTVESSIFKILHSFILQMPSFIFQKCLFKFQCSQTGYFARDCTRSKLQSSNPQDRNWLTGASGSKHKPSSSQIGLNLIFTLKIIE